MNAGVIDTVRKLLSQYTFVQDSDTNNKDLTCIMCHKIKMDTYQTHCGCIYCEECVIYFDEGDNECRGFQKYCKQECIIREKNLFKNAILNRKILRLRVYCPNELCQHITELSDMDNHLRGCQTNRMECPFRMIGCDNEGSSQGDILAHLHVDVSAHSLKLVEYLCNLKNEIGVLKKDLALSTLEIASLRKGSATERNDLIHQSEQRSQRLKNDILEQIRIERREQTNNIEEQTKRIAIVRQELKKIHMTTVAFIVLVVCSIFYNYRISYNKGNEGKNMTIVGVRSFTVDRFSQKKYSEYPILSPHFYSHLNGYKLQLMVYPGKTDTAGEKYLSIYVKICEGEFNDLLNWPFMLTLHLSIINQIDGNAYNIFSLKYSNVSDELKHVSKKPVTRYNSAYGFPQFISHSALESNPGFIVDDSVIVRCVVEHGQDS